MQLAAKPGKIFLLIFDGLVSWLIQKYTEGTATVVNKMLWRNLGNSWILLFYKELLHSKNLLCLHFLDCYYLKLFGQRSVFATLVFKAQ